MTAIRASFRNTPEFKEFKKALTKLSYPSKNAKIQLRNKIKKLYKLNSDLMRCDVQNIINTSEDVKQCISKVKALKLKTTGVCKLYSYVKQYNTIRNEYYQMHDEFITQYKQSVIKLKSKRSSKITKAKAYMILCKLYQLLNLSVPSSFLEFFMKCVDHLGNQFNTRQEMCKHYNITPKTLNNRLNKGFALCDALTMPYRMRNRYVIWGNEFGSIKEACEHYHVPYGAIRQRVYRGADLADVVLLDL